VEPTTGRGSVRANPVPGVRAKAHAFAELLSLLRPDQGATVVTGLVVPVEPVRIDAHSPAGRYVVCEEGETSIGTALRERLYHGASGDPAGPVGERTVAQLEEAIRGGRDEGFIRPADHYRRVGDYRLGELLFAGATYQDFRAHQVSDARSTVRVRRFNVATPSSG